MQESEILDRVAANPNGVVRHDLFQEARTAGAAVRLTNTLARLVRAKQIRLAKRPEDDKVILLPGGGA